ncbi:hypothetical protein F0562_028756 [Nyssa sinensis]|uniref:Uncharacterized protein n=1 Tax=Nyssa sinensis TaxID=561372 RepID=A0A5J5B113_9ASTE|nr:hypothetical protein F0562_028756 [Nyssa sinensis]
MEGLIPFLFRALKKPRPHHNFRSFSDGSTRSYHVLLASDAIDGSSHRRTRSEFQPPTVDFLQQRSGLEFSHPRSFNKALRSSTHLIPTPDGSSTDHDSLPVLGENCRRDYQIEVNARKGILAYSYQVTASRDTVQRNRHRN